MVIEYKIKFEDGGVTVTQSVTRTADDGGGSGPQSNPVPGGSGPQSNPAGKGGGGPNSVIGVIFGPLVIGSAGPSASGQIQVVTNLKPRP